MGRPKKQKEELGSFDEQEEKQEEKKQEIIRPIDQELADKYSRHTVRTLKDVADFTRELIADTVSGRMSVATSKAVKPLAEVLFAAVAADSGPAAGGKEAGGLLDILTMTSKRGAIKATYYQEVEMEPVPVMIDVVENKDE